MSKYVVCELFPDESTSVEGVKKLFELLKLNYLNKEEKISIENTCAKFSDIFHMPGDKLSDITKLYKESIRVKEKFSAVYVKPYRLPKHRKNRNK